SRKYGLLVVSFSTSCCAAVSDSAVRAKQRKYPRIFGRGRTRVQKGCEGAAPGSTGSRNRQSSMTYQWRGDVLFGTDSFPEKLLGQAMDSGADYANWAFVLQALWAKFARKEFPRELSGRKISCRNLEL